LLQCFVQAELPEDRSACCRQPTQKQNGTVDMSIQPKIHALGSVRQPSPCGTRVRRRARLQEIAVLALVIVFGALGNLRPSLASPMATGADPTAASALFKRN
jgi:hypothetical protein